MSRWLWRWGPVAVVMALIFGASSVPDLPAPPGGVSDKTAHLVAYAVLGAVALRAIADMRWERCTWRTSWQAWVFAAGYGATDELHQALVPARTPSVQDWIADAYGAALAVLVILTLAVLRRHKNRAV